MRALIPLLIFLVFSGPGELWGKEPFSIVVVPDSQKYLQNPEHRDILEGQMRWIANNREKLNCKFVIHEGDVVENPESEEEWAAADQAFKVLDGALPYGISVGNHDMVVKTRDKTLFHKYFPIARAEKSSGFGGHHPTQKDNRYYLFEAADMPFMVLCLEYRPPTEILEWANAIVEKHPDHRVIVNTHSYLQVNERNEIGKDVWENFAKRHANIFMIVCGHLSVGRRAASGVHGNVVHELLANYQGLRRGGNGWLRILRFVPDENRIEVSTYSTLLNRYMGKGDPKWSRLQDNFFELPYVMASEPRERSAPEFTANPTPARQEQRFAPTTDYARDNIEGWTVLVHRELEFDHAVLHGDAMALLREKLRDIKRVVPRRALAELQKIPIWCEFAHPKHPCACYHPDAGWLRDNDMNPEKAGAVELANARNFIDWSEAQPWMVLHELAHGYHFRTLGGDHEGIDTAYRAAVAKGHYEEVERYNGKKMRHYALTDNKEYFAEATEAYFGKNDYYPFNRAQLAKHDPAAFAIVEETWGVPPTAPMLELVSLGKIWDAAPHNAFTDLVRWKDRFWCAFREGKGHAGDRGKLRLIVSDDGATWDSAKLFEMPEHDLRDAALSVTPAGKLHVLGGAQQIRDGVHVTGTWISESPDGETWSAPEVVVPLGRWLWRITWRGDEAFGVSYATPEGKPWSALHSTRDGRTFDARQPKLLGAGGWPTEARIRFADDGTAYCLHRRDGKHNTAYFGTANPPYESWAWQDLGAYFGGPNFLQIPDGRWIGAGRLMLDGGAKTALTHIDVTNGTMEALLTLPSGGDTSYPGMVWHDDHLWVSYYASHEGKTSIYLAKLRVGSL